MKSRTKKVWSDPAVRTLDATNKFEQDTRNKVLAPMWTTIRRSVREPITHTVIIHILDRFI
jgi:hypothetical protein